LYHPILERGVCRDALYSDLKNTTITPNGSKMIPTWLTLSEPSIIYTIPHQQKGFSFPSKKTDYIRSIRKK
jgi:hypothetical protein